MVPSAPLFRDPIYDGAADPAIIRNRRTGEWWIFYTNRRAFSPCLDVEFMHGTDIGIAPSSDGGRTWVYRGTAQGLCYEPGRNTYWAPEIIEHNGICHMYVSYVQGIVSSWEYPRTILHYTSSDLWNWDFQSELQLSSERVIDACVHPMSDGRFKMWYKDELHESHTWSAVSEDLDHWTVCGPEITDCPHEGPNVFFFHDLWWMITDTWNGLGVYKSTDAQHWQRCPDILKEPGIRKDDGTIANHADVLVYQGHAYIFYFTHPELKAEERNHPDFSWKGRGYEQRRTSLQAAELISQNGILVCDRDHVNIEL